MEPNLLKLKLMRHLRGLPCRDSDIRVKRGNTNVNTIHTVQILERGKANQELVVPMRQRFPLPFRTICEPGLYLPHTTDLDKRAVTVRIVGMFPQ
jgi:hypothetical protein